MSISPNKPTNFDLAELYAEKTQIAIEAMCSEFSQTLTNGELDVQTMNLYAEAAENIALYLRTSAMLSDLRPARTQCPECGCNLNRYRDGDNE